MLMARVPSPKGGTISLMQRLQGCESKLVMIWIYHLSLEKKVNGTHKITLLMSTHTVISFLYKLQQQAYNVCIAVKSHPSKWIQVRYSKSSKLFDRHTTTWSTVLMPTAPLNVVCIHKESQVLDRSSQVVPQTAGRTSLRREKQNMFCLHETHHVEGPTLQVPKS